MARTWTSPRTWVTNEIATETIFNTHVRDDLDFLFQTAAVQVYKSGSQSHGSSGSWVTVSFDTDDIDPLGWHDTVTNNSRITIAGGNAEGIYLAHGRVTFDSATTTIGARIQENGTTLRGQVLCPSVGINGTAAHVTAIVRLAAAEYVELQAYQASGGALNIRGTNLEETSLQLAWICGV